MKLMKLFIFPLILLFPTLMLAQETISVEVNFKPYFGGVPLVLNHDHLSNTPPKVSTQTQIEVLRLYISKVELFHEQSLVFSEENSFHLLDAEDKSSMSFSLDVPSHLTYTHLKFQIGVDSVTNTSGAMGGDLDPIHGMYWSWQSGYINFKLEGTAKDCPARKNRFQYHIGGYQYPFNTIQAVTLEVLDKKEIAIQMNLDEIFKTIDVANSYQIMSPNQTSVDFSNLLTTIFAVAP